jgi:uncharacterized membrane protein YfcA
LLLPDVSVAELTLIAALAAVSAVTGGVAGYGTGALMPLILVPILGAAPVVPIIAISAMFTNTARVAAFRHLLDRRRAVIALVAALPTCVLGAWLYTLLTGRGAALVIGSTLIATVPLRRLLKRHGHKLSEKAYAAAAAGWGIVVGGTTGAGVILLSLLMATGLRRGRDRDRCRGLARHGRRQDRGVRRGRSADQNRDRDRIADRPDCFSVHVFGQAHRRASARSRSYRNA